MRLSSHASTTGRVLICVYQTSGIVIDQARKGGFRLRTIDEFAEAEIMPAPTPSYDAERGTPSDLEKKRSEEFVEAV